MIINGKEYSWGSIKVFMLGKVVVGVQKIEYKLSKEKEARYGMGDTPHGIQHGNRSAEGSIEVSQSEVIALNKAAKAAGYRDLLDIELDIIVIYAENGVVTQDIIRNASFKEDPRTMTQGDKIMKVNIPFVATDVEHL